METPESTACPKLSFNNYQDSDMICILKFGDGSKEPMREYHLHQTLVCDYSDYFKIHCSFALSDADGRKIVHVFAIPSIFEKIFRWIYGDWDLSEWNDVDTILEALTYIFTYFEGPKMNDLRMKLLERLFSSKLQKEGDSQDTYTPWGLLNLVCSSAADWNDCEFLRKFLKAHTPEIKVPLDWLEKLATEPESVNGFLAALLIPKNQG
ncbi:hypothetical protein TWF481_003190 [Arthrobotrys musiformis]|uniref:BTB domain-containing protein n=1 Tax=Arthrobotrys musiformis TaxID=47236 RepID=A0AAV9VPH8_9PEZI